MNAPAFVAPAWLRNAHLQTTFPVLFRRLALPSRRRERYTLPDGDILDLDWLDDDSTRPLVIVLHGLAGSSDSVYVLGIQAALRACGIGSVAMNFRGTGGRPNLRARTYHAGDTGDVAALAASLGQRFPSRALGAVGYSLGGNVLLKWLGETGAASPLAAACAVSAPFDLAACSAQLDRGLSRIYRNRLRDELVAGLIAKERALRAHGNADEADALRALGDLGSIRTFREYDGRIVAPLHGFRDADDYYARCSARGFLRGIAVPTRIVHALDDPFMTPGVVPTANEVPACVELAVSAHGGHVGFVDGQPGRVNYWLERCIPAFFAARLAGN